MADNNYLPMPRALAAEGSPIIINNACVSWHELAGRFLFSVPRAYVGTLNSVSDLEAEAIVIAPLGQHFGKMLPHALWAAQNGVYGAGSDRRPYLVSPASIRSGYAQRSKMYHGMFSRSFGTAYNIGSEGPRKPAKATVCARRISTRSPHSMRLPTGKRSPGATS